MADVTTVTLPVTHAPEFPPRCVGCSQKAPEHYIKVGSTKLSWRLLVSWLPGFAWFPGKMTVIVPICKKCKSRLRNRTLLSTGLLTFTCVIALWWTWGFFVDIQPKLLRRALQFGTAFLCIVPQIIFEIRFPAIFDITARPRAVDYEFLDIDCALRFAAKNRTAEFMLINGQDFKENRMLWIYDRHFDLS